MDLTWSGSQPVLKVLAAAFYGSKLINNVLSIVLVIIGSLV